MEYNKHKDADPKDTVAHIREILSSVGIEMEPSEPIAVGSLYSVRLECPPMHWGVNGKGTSLEWCMASAYGEAIERLQGCYAYALGDVSPEAAAHGGFARDPEEEFVRIADVKDRAPLVWEEMRRSARRNGGRADDAAIEEIWTHRLGSQVALVPYYSAAHKSVVPIPDAIISNLEGSNGLSSGNTPAEALCQGFSEVFERMVCAQMLDERLVPPAVDRSYLAQAFPELERMMRDIESLGDFHVAVRDCSLGKGYPVMGIVLVDRATQRYHVKFGSHPSFAVALERCLTEIVQGYVPGEDKAKDDQLLASWQTVPASAFDMQANRFTLFRDGSGLYPDSFFAGEPSWEFKPWPQGESLDNKFSVRRMASLLLDLAGEVYVRDLGYLGVPAYRIFAPGIPTLAPAVSLKSIQDRKTLDELLALPNGSDDVDDKQRRRMLDLLQDDDTHLLTGLDLIGGVPKVLVHAALLCDDGQTQAAASMLRSIDLPVRQYRCAARDLELAAEGVDVSTRDELLRLFFTDVPLSYVKMNWRGSSKVKSLFGSPLKRLLAKKPEDQGAQRSNDFIDSLHMRLQDRKITGMRDQAALEKFLT